MLLSANISYKSLIALLNGVNIHSHPWKQATLITVNVHLIKLAAEKEI